MKIHKAKKVCEQCGVTEGHSFHLWWCPWAGAFGYGDTYSMLDQVNEFDFVWYAHPTEADAGVSWRYIDDCYRVVGSSWDRARVLEDVRTRNMQK